MAEGPLPAREVFAWQARVYWEDTDAGGVVYHANYLKFFERARTEWLRSLGIEQEAQRRGGGPVVVVARAALEYLAPARLDDELRLSVAIAHRGRASAELQQNAWRLRPQGLPGEPASGPQLLARAALRLGCVDAQTLRPKPWPELWWQALSP